MSEVAAFSYIRDKKNSTLVFPKSLLLFKTKSVLWLQPAEATAIGEMDCFYSNSKKMRALTL